MHLHDTPRLLADVGSTHARFALERAAGRLEHAVTLRCADHADFSSALRAYLAQLGAAEVRHAAVAIANPVEGDRVRMTNSPWQFSIEETRERADLETLVVVNDYTALASALPHLAPQDLRQVGGGRPVERSVKAVLGAGTGLGVSGVIPADDGWISLGSEGGHVSFAPADPREAEVLACAWEQYPHVSAERLICSSGLELIHRALLRRQTGGEPAERLNSHEILRRAVGGQHRDCVEAAEMFCAMLGTVASNLALTLGAFGGVYVAGGIVPALGAFFDRSPFRARFEAKGRFRDYLAAIPTYVVTADRAAFTGISSILDAQLRRRANRSSIIDRIRRGHAALSPAERRVADLVLSRPRSVLKDPISEIALAAEVSQPTVIRFCRSVGCQGLLDFKLRLASGLTGTIPVVHTQVNHADGSLELGAKVLGNTASAVLQVRDQLDRDAIDRAIGLLGAARRIECYGVGEDAVVAQDAQAKFLRLGVGSAAYTDAHQQLMAARVLSPADVVLVTCGSGKRPEVLEAVDQALASGAPVIAVTASQSSLARRATVAVQVDHAEDALTHVPMIGRILHLLVIDILAVGVAMRHRSRAVESIGNGDAGTVPTPLRPAMVSAPATALPADPAAPALGLLPHSP